MARSPASRSKNSVVSGGQRPQQRRLADAALAEDRRLDATALGQTLVGENDGERHQMPSFSTMSWKVSLPARTVRAGSKILAMCFGQEAYLRLRDLEAHLDIVARVFAVGLDALDELEQFMLVPVDLLRQIGHDGDVAISEAGHAEVLVGLGTGSLGALGVFLGQRAIEPGDGELGFAQGVVCFLLEAGELCGGQARRSRPSAGARARRW